MLEAVRFRSCGVEAVDLRHPSGAGATILAGCGAVWNELRVAADEGVVRLLDGYRDAEDLRKNHPVEFKGAKLSPFPNRVRDGRYRFEGATYELPINFPQEGHAIHGLVYAARFRTERLDPGEDAARVDLVHDYAGDAPGYPFPFCIAVRFELGGPRRLGCRTTVTNTGDRVLPLGDGWHPYFDLGVPVDELELAFPAAERLELDERRIPTGATVPDERFVAPAPLDGVVLDDAFRFRAAGPFEVLLRRRDGARAVALRLETGYGFLQVYTPPHRRSIALEPMSCAPDAFNNGLGLVRLTPGETASFAWSVEATATG